MKAFFRVLKKGRHFSVAFETNRLRATTFPVRDCTSFTAFGEDILRIALTLSGFASISLCDTMNPRNFPEETPKAHFDGFSFMLYYLSVLNVSLKSSR